MVNLLLPQQLQIEPHRHDPDPLVIYHARCPDGFGAALAAWLFYEGRAEFLACAHGDIEAVEDLPRLDGRAVYILDFSFAPDLLSEIERRAAKLVLLDHHKSAAEKLTGFACRCGVVHFDMQRSGARLAWDFFQADRSTPALVRYIEDRDLWNWAYPESAAFLSALDMESMDFERWAEISSYDESQLADFMSRGRAMDEKFRKLAQDMVANAEPIVFMGRAGLMLNAPGAFHSLLGDILSRQSGSYALLWSAAKGGVVKVGLRSQKDFDCIPLAESMGGGGHAQACGFRMKAERLSELLSGVFNP
ncbi:phosphoesterase [Hylemonella gracilis]|uniref:Phosphoesterase n=1 Tax=Hylemonella gracilis TaxID=80880 RepID=A0A4P6UL06_9BURK|nr:DHHA1 domain-containing protein [Hylemonella gracilis]QBK06068.1 phosphoesterase [Hylemonella gracilis]